MKLIIMKGLPASGKTTWARKWVTEDPKNRVRVSRDDIRKMLGPYWVPQREDLVTDIENETIKSALLNGFSVVVDATNLRGIERFKQLITEFENYDESIPIDNGEFIKLSTKDMTDVPKKLCIQRDQQRTGDDYVGKEVINRMYDKYLRE